MQQRVVKYKIHAYSIYIASDMAVQGGRHNYTDVCIHVACMHPLAMTYVHIIIWYSTPCAFYEVELTPITHNMYTYYNQ